MNIPMYAFQLEPFFIKACRTGDLATVRYILTTTDLSQQFEKKSIIGFAYACSTGRFNIIDYFINYLNPENIVEGIKVACNSGQLNVVKYLVLEHNISMTPILEKYLSDSKNLNKLGNQQVLKIFSSRDSYHGLHQNLPVKQKVNKTLKI